MVETPRFSLIIPFQAWSADLDECLTHARGLEGPAWEAILLPDEATGVPAAFADLPLTILPTGPVGPALKRDRGAEVARGEILAFLDDDAYPLPDWLTQAEAHWQALPRAGALGGPATTPRQDPFWARVSGAVFLSRLAGGFPERYVPLPPSRRVEDWPSVNLMVRKSVFQQVGGFDSQYWPGEDTKLCLDIVQAGWEIHYVPAMRVFHHRRATLKKHLRQIGNYGFHRGLFARRHPETSRKPLFFVPSLFVLFLGAGIPLSIYSPMAALLFSVGMFLYSLALVRCLMDILRHEEGRVALSSLPFIVMTHIWYGVRFMQGISTREYKESLGR